MIRTSGRSNSRRALTLVEIMVALAVSMILIAIVAAAFIQIIRSSDEAESVVRAHSSGRSGVEAIARDLRRLQLDADFSFQQLVLIDRPLTYGDNVDNDDDGSVDEEVFDGRDNDGDWTNASDRHATIGAFTERANFVGIPDYGDEHVDEDCRFSADELTFILPAGADGIGSPRKRVTYRLGSFDGEDHVLLRIVEENPTLIPGSQPVVVEPLLFEVVSLDILAWNPNDNTSSPVAGSGYWEESWNSAVMEYPAVEPLNAPDETVPPFRLPASFLIRVTMSAERVPLSEIAGWPLGNRPLRVVSMTTVVNVEQTIENAVYDEYVRSSGGGGPIIGEGKSGQRPRNR